MHWPPFSWVDEDGDQPEAPAGGIETQPPVKRTGRKASPESHPIPAWTPPALAVGRKSGRRGAPNPGGRPRVQDYIEYSCIMDG